MATAMIQIRNVPSELHRTLKSRAALAGMSLSDYLITELRRIAERPSREELQQRLASRTPIVPREPIVEAVAAERHGR